MTFETATTTAAIVTRLASGWSLESVSGPVPASVVGKSIPATVPGSVHTDLLAAGLIVDPYLDDHERLLAWIGYSDWRYVSTFEWVDSGHDNVELVFEGLDTLAHIELNGVVLGDTVNMHRTYRFDARGAIRDGSNDLVVTFRSAIKFADRMSLELGYRPHVNHHPYNAIRKMACSFGWDWGLDTASAGIWRPVFLHEWSRARLSSVRPTTTLHGETGIVSVRVDVDGAADDLRLRVTVGGHSAESPVLAGTADVRLELEAVRRWWPAGFGGQDLYDVDVELLADGSVVDSVTKRVGFRTVELDTSADAAGAGMTFIVNGQPIFVRGANWIPDDAFPHRVTRERYDRRIGQARSANINLLRVWGGGIFESDDFYELCDEQGVMVWQDFLFACAAYAEEEPMWSEVEAEARDNIARLMPHPSLIIWNGSNENLEGFHDWGWQARLEGRTWGAGYYDRLLPSLISELDPGRVYTPSSPWSPDGVHKPNDPAYGSIHIWDMWNRQDYADYRLKPARFVSEFGWQGPPTWSTLRKAISDEPLTPESPGMLVHQKAMQGNDKLTDGLVAHLPLPNDIEDWHWAMSLNQAIAVRVGIEHLRSLSPSCAGSIVWQLNDCWPATSWAAVDGYGRAKPLLYSIRHAYRDLLVTVQPRGAGLAAVIVNDSSDAVSGRLELARMGFDGTVHSTATVDVVIAPRGALTTELPESVMGFEDPASELIVAALGDSRGTWFPAEYKDSSLTRASMTASADRVDGGYRVSIAANSLVRDLALLADKVHPDAVVDDMLVTLLPGESVVFTVVCDQELDPDQFLAPGVLRTGNDLLHPRGSVSP